MKKILLISLSAITFMFGLLYILAFTSFGNNLLKPRIEAKINATSPLPLSLKEFTLDINTLRVLIEIDQKNSILAYGQYSLFSQTFDINYELKLTDLSLLSEVAKRQLSGALLSQGEVRGELENFTVKGESDLAKSDTKYTVVLKEMNLNKAAIKLSNLDIKTLLSMLGEKNYSSGKVDLHVQLTDLSPQHMRGSVVAKIKKANLNAKTIKKELGFQLSRTSLKSDLKATFNDDNINYLFTLNSELAQLYSKGKANLSKESIETIYKINIRELALLQSITQSKLRGPFSTQGVIVGDKKSLMLKGKTDIASSMSSYDIQLKELKPSKLIVHIKKARLDKLLYMSGQEKFASANINADIVLNNLDPKNLDGKALIKLSNGKINQSIMKKSFDIKLPKTDFNLEANMLLNRDKINYTLALVSNLAKIHSQGNLKTEDLQTDARYRVDIKELALLKPISKAPLRGPFATSGTIKGDKESMQVKGESNLASSKTRYDLKLKNFTPQQINLSIENAKLDKLLYFAGEPSYAKAELNLNANLSSITPLNGKIILTMNKGLTDTKTIKKAFDISLPSTKFNMRSDGLIKEDKLTAKTTFNSGLANIIMKKSELNIKTTTLKTDYELNIPSLLKLEPLLERKLHGKFSAKGELTKEKQLIITAHSNIFKGKFNAKIVDNDVKANFKDLRALEVLKMMGYPQVIDAPINGNLNYNTKTRIGKLDTNFDRAALKPSKMTELIGALTHTDLTKERFNQGSLISLINKDIIKSKFEMRSKTVKIHSKKFIINSKKQLIDARFALQVKKYPGDVLVTGNINTPHVKIDAKSMITPEVEEKVSKEINRFLKKLF